MSTPASNAQSLRRAKNENRIPASPPTQSSDPSNLTDRSPALAPGPPVHPPGKLQMRTVRDFRLMSTATSHPQSLRRAKHENRISASPSMQTSDPSNLTDRFSARPPGPPDSAESPRAMIPIAFSVETCARRRLAFPVPLGAGTRDGDRSQRCRLFAPIAGPCVLSRFLCFLTLLTALESMTGVFAFRDVLSVMIRKKLAALGTFAVLTIHNAVTAFEASGVCLHGMTPPVLLAGSDQVPRKRLGARHPLDRSNLTRPFRASINPLLPQIHFYRFPRSSRW